VYHVVRRVFFCLGEEYLLLFILGGWGGGAAGGGIAMKMITINGNLSE